MSDTQTQPDTLQSSAPDQTDTAPDTEEPAPAGRIDSAKAEAENALYAVSESDMGGMSFIFTCNNSNAVFGEFESEKILSRTKHERVQTLNERLNVDIIITEAAYQDMVSELSAAMGAGMVYTHMLAVDARYIGSLSYNGMIGNINALPFVDLTQPYFDAGFTAEMTTPTGVYAVYGDGCRDEESLGVVYYNETIASSLGISDLEQAVRDGAWRMDLFSEYVKTASAAGQNGAGYVALATPDTERMLHSFYVCTEMDSVTLNGGNLTLVDNREKGDRLISSLKVLLSSFRGGESDGVSAEQHFFSGGALFFAGDMGDMHEFYNMADVWGMLPMPTLDGGTSYRTPISKSTQVMCYPNSGVNANETGIMLQSLFASSYKLMDAALTEQLLHSYVRNEKALDMLSYILSDIHTDTVLSYGDEFAKYADGSIGAFISSCSDDTLYSSRFARLRTAANRSLQFVK